MPTPTQTATAYLNAFEQGDFETARSLLADEFSFNGPMMQFEGADQFLGAIKEMSFGGEFVERWFLETGDTVVMQFRFNLESPAPASVPMCEVLEIADGRVASSRLYFDTALFPGMDKAS